MALNEAASWPNSSPLRTGIGLLQISRGKPLGAGFQIAQGHVDQAVHEKADARAKR